MFFSTGDGNCVITVITIDSECSCCVASCVDNVSDGDGVGTSSTVN
ncbi:hypothetical protein [Prochlorococcus sp. MIT 0718]